MAGLGLGRAVVGASTTRQYRQRCLAAAPAGASTTVPEAIRIAPDFASGRQETAGISGTHISDPLPYQLVSIANQAREIRRKVCAEWLPGSGLLYVEAGEPARRNGYDVDHDFRPDSNFAYLTGGAGARPGFAVVVDAASGATTLLAPKLPPEMVYWVGPQPSLEELAEAAGADRCVYKDDLPALLREHATRHEDDGALQLHTSASSVEALKAAAPQGAQVNTDVLPSTLARCRATKTDAEVACLLRANQVSGAAHLDVMRAAAPGLREAHLGAVFAASTRCGGLPALGYPTIVGTGSNAAVMHYAAGEAALAPGQIVLMDAGAEYRYYTADITRCFPACASTGLGAAERDVYQAVLDSQMVALEAITPGAAWSDIDRTARVVILERLRDMGVLRRGAGSDDAALAAKLDRVFFPHGLGHFLGLDVHDVSDVGPVPKTLAPGHVVTCEPGLYFIRALLDKAEADSKQAPFIDFARARALLPLGGVRIEDNVLVTAQGAFNLTDAAGVSKRLADVMAVSRSAYQGPLAAVQRFPAQDGAY